MIIPMKKITLFVNEGRKEESLNKLREFGALHVKYIQEPVSEDINTLEKELSQAESALRTVNNLEEEPANSTKTSQSSQEIVSEIIAMNEEKEELQEQLLEERGKLVWFNIWGDVQKQDIEYLRKNDIYIRLYEVDNKRLEQLKEEYPVFVVEKSKTISYIAFISRDEEVKLDQKEILPPDKSMQEVNNAIDELENRLDKINQILLAHKNNTEEIEDYIKELEKKLEYVRVSEGMAAESAVAYLQGFCPQELIADFKEKAEAENWGYVIQDPDEPNEVPTKLSDTKSKKLVEPIYNFMGTLPGYQEYDISSLFLIFFAVFVAMIVGDAGYGLIYLGLTLLARKKMPDAPKDNFHLFYILSGATIIWGLLTGTIFGAPALQNIPPFKYLIVDNLNTFVSENSSLIMFITFVVGAIQLTFGHVMQLKRNLDSPKFLAQVGWIAVVWGMLFVAESIVLGGEVVQGAVSLTTVAYVIGGGAVLVLFTENYEKGKLFKGMAQTIGNLPMDIISAFSDIVSYIRLFAVGLATVVIEQSFNSMAIGEGIDSVTGFIVAALVLLLGHSLNLILAVMSIVVHGIRLNMLEFSTHLGMTWSGKPYKPFKK
ncbi:MAG: hypothetical protein K9M80_01760 [Candidatus Marinimicrobia bacterium]|nr:hypothetical protein [Candidatus Neomarinimicrobiota bacterium]